MVDNSDTWSLNQSYTDYMYSIKAVAQATGLTVETIRAWERRYKVVTPVRDSSGRRIYRPDDVLRLRRLHEATERGHAISRVAALSDEGLAALLEAPASRAAEGTAAALVTRILTAAEEFRLAECEHAVTLAAAVMPPARLVSDVLQPVLREVGERWHSGGLSVSQERLVSNVVGRHVALLLDAYARAATRETIAFATLPGERHELGLLMAAMICASRGFKAHYLGADLPPVEIARSAEKVDAAIVALSIVLRDQADEAAEHLAALAAALPANTGIWIGGSGSAAFAGMNLPRTCVLLRDSVELEQRLDLRQH